MSRLKRVKKALKVWRLERSRYGRPWLDGRGLEWVVSGWCAEEVEILVAVRSSWRRVGVEDELDEWNGLVVVVEEVEMGRDGIGVSSGVVEPILGIYSEGCTQSLLSSFVE